jgi:protein TonB
MGSVPPVRCTSHFDRGPHCASPFPGHAGSGPRYAPPVGHEDDPDRDAILARRRKLVALALTGVTSLGACGEDAMPGPCLSPPIDPSQQTQQEVREPRDPNAGPVAPEGEDTPPRPPPMPCLSPVGPPEPMPPPMPCLRPMRREEPPPPPPLPCLSPPLPEAEEPLLDPPPLTDGPRETDETPELQPLPQPAPCLSRLR